MMERWTTDDGAVLAARIDGRADRRARPALLLHWLFFDGTMFDAMRSVLGGRRVVRPDHRGQGVSEAGRDAPTAERLAADMAALLDRVAPGPVHLVGSSMGAYVAMEVLRADPSRVATLTLSCCTCRPEADPDRFEALASRIEAVGGRGLGAELSALMFGTPFLSDPARAADRERWRARFDALPDGTAAVVRGIFAHDGWTDLLRRWGGPILALSGAEDRAKSPSNLAWIADAGLGRHVVLPGAGHTPAVETPGPFAQAVGRFIASHDIERTPA